jgi:hypothetical protein
MILGKCGNEPVVNTQEYVYNLKGSDGGVQHSEILGLWALVHLQEF